MTGYVPAVGDSRGNILARLLGTGDPIQQLPAGPVPQGPQMTQGDPSAVPFFPPLQQLFGAMAAMPPDQRRNLLAMLLERRQ